jgi:hypothetical protein
VSIRSKAKRAASAGLAISLTVLVATSSAFGRELPKTEQELIDQVRTAIAKGDMDTFSDLVNWQGAGEMKRRVTNFQIRHSLGRNIRSIKLEPFPEDGLREIEARGTLKANMPVIYRLRVEYDEAAVENGASPASVFLVGKMDDAYRIALIIATKRRDD